MFYDWIIFIEKYQYQIMYIKVSRLLFKVYTDTLLVSVVSRYRKYREPIHTKN